MENLLYFILIGVAVVVIVGMIMKSRKRNNDTKVEIATMSEELQEERKKVEIMRSRLSAEDQHKLNIARLKQEIEELKSEELKSEELNKEKKNENQGNQNSVDNIVESVQNRSDEAIIYNDSNVESGEEELVVKVSEMLKDDDKNEQ